MTMNRSLRKNKKHQKKSIKRYHRFASMRGGSIDDQIENLAKEMRIIQDNINGTSERERRYYDYKWDELINQMKALCKEAPPYLAASKCKIYL